MRYAKDSVCIFNGSNVLYLNAANTEIYTYSSYYLLYSQSLYGRSLLLF